MPKLKLHTRPARTADSLSSSEATDFEGFPDDYKFVGSMTDIVRLIGNAVPIALGHVLGQAIATGLAGKVAEPEVQELF